MANRQGAGIYDETTSRLWPDPAHGPWLLTLFWKRKGGRPELVGQQLLPATADDAEELKLMTTTLRDLRIAEVAIEQREQLPYKEPAPALPEPILAGMRPATIERLKRVANAYQEAWAAGENPTKAVARKLNLTAPAAGNLVKRARDAGFLPPTSAGKPQG